MKRTKYGRCNCWWGEPIKRNGKCRFGPCGGSMVRCGAIPNSKRKPAKVKP